MFDIITFGSATWDIFLTPEDYSSRGKIAWQTAKNKKFVTGRGICFNLGSKVDIGNMSFSSGGGGTNTAATFSKQGLKTVYCGRVGQDLAGEEIIKELKQLGVDARFISKTSSKPTNHSIVINLKNEDRTILVYRGASELLSKKDIPWEKLKAKWFYLAPLSGRIRNISEDIVNFACKNKIKVAFNPGNFQLSLPSKILKRILKKVNILILNQEEASLLTKTSYQEEKKVFKKIDEMCSGITIMTKGERGAVVSDGEHLYKAGGSKLKVVASTGAGDAFGAGFVSGFIKKNNIPYAIQLASANASSCIQKIGAKNGLLKKTDAWHKVKVVKSKL